MSDKILCFSLNGYSLGVEHEQVEKILINKHPNKESFVLETGVEVKSLKTYIPLPEQEQSAAGNIFFLRDQKDFYGFTVDRILGYLTLTGIERIRPRRSQSPVKYFVKKEGKLIPVLDLQYITNNENSVNSDDISEIASFSFMDVRTGQEAEQAAAEEDVDKDEVYRAIEEEIQKRKTTELWDESVQSEKRGIVLPLIVNVVIIALVSMGILFYFIAGRRRENDVGPQGVKTGGVEEEIIREIQKRAEAELEEQRMRLEEARLRLDQLQKEKDSFLTDQDAILAQREKALNEAYQRQLEEARDRLVQSGVQNVDEAFAKERERLYREFLDSRERVRGEVEDVKAEYERQLQRQEEGLRREMSDYAGRIRDTEQKLVEERAKLKESEERAQNIAMQQQEYLAFRRQLNTMYNQALGYLTSGNYPQGIEDLKKIPPVIASARARRIADDASLRVEDDLARNLLYLAEREQSRANLEQIGQKTYEAALALEREGKREEALPRFFTVYTVSGDASLKERALGRAESIMDDIYRDRTAREKREIEQKASALYKGAMESKRRGELDKALQALEEAILSYPSQSVNKSVLEEIVAINDLRGLQAEGQDLASLNQRAAEVMRSAKSAYDSGYYSEALDKYEEVAKKYKASDYAEPALSEIVRINEEMRKLKYTPTFTLKKGEVKTGVIVQLLPESSILVSMGTEDGVKQGDILQVFRNVEGTAVFVGSLKIYEINPKTSKGRVVYFNQTLKVGDIVSY